MADIKIGYEDGKLAVSVDARVMGWSEETTCRVCGATLAGMDDMCPNRDRVCKYCCLPCIESQKCVWGTSPGEGRDSLEHTLNAESHTKEEFIAAARKFYKDIGEEIPIESAYGVKLR